jgi:phosphatidylglycerol lysyltransferase
VQVAEDALLPLACLQFAGKKWQNVRNAVNKAAGEGSIATAIGRAYLPHLTSRQALRLFTKLRWSR